MFNQIAGFFFHLVAILLGCGTVYGFKCPECGLCRRYTEVEDPQIICCECEKLFLNPLDENFKVEALREITEKNVEIVAVENNRIMLRGKNEVAESYLENILGLPRHKEKQGFFKVSTNLFEVKKPRSWHLSFSLGVLAMAAIWYILPDTITILY